MKRFIYGQIMGGIQLIFWLIMIPWIIITIPLDLYYTNPLHEAPTWLAVIFEQSWIDWTYGLMMISTLNTLARKRRQSHPLNTQFSILLCK